MKKIFISGILLGGIILPVFAGGAVPGGNASELTQIANHVELIPTNISSGITSVNAQILGAKAIMDPISTSLITIQQLSAAKSMLTLVTGGSQGSSLIISNPQNYIDKQGLAVVKIGLGALAAQKNGAFTNSLLSSLTNNFKSVSFTAKLQANNTSNLPSIIQKKACDDTTLSNLAKEDVTANGNAFDNAAFQARKQYLYQQLCANNPSNDPKTAAALNKLNTARPEVGGWDTWLDITGGDNPYTKTVQNTTILAQAANAKKQAATDDLNRGRGTVSQTKCLVRAPTDENGDPYSNPDLAPCISDAVINPAGLVADTLSKAQFAGFDRATFLQASPFTELLTNLGTLFQGAQSILNAGSSQNTSTSQTVSSEEIQDLANDPNKKNETAEPILSMLDINENSLNDLESADDDIRSILGTYSDKVTATKACYQAIGDTSANSTLADRATKISAMEQNLESDSEGIASGRALIESSREEISTAQSSQKISTIYDNFLNESRNLPNANTTIMRKTAYAKYKDQVESDMGSNGDLTNLQTRCESMRASQGSSNSSSNVGAGG